MLLYMEVNKLNGPVKNNLNFFHILFVQLKYCYIFAPLIIKYLCYGIHKTVIKL